MTDLKRVAADLSAVSGYLSNELNRLELAAKDKDEPIDIDQVIKVSAALCQVTDSQLRLDAALETAPKEAEKRRQNTAWMQAKKERFKRIF